MAGASEHRRVCPVIAGPTAVGKTGLILDLAAEFPIEVISLDSRQVYCGLKIGTAQPTPAEQAVCVHHLIDFIPPEERYSAQRFRADFIRCWDEIVARGRLPVLAGGAGLYLRAVSDGFFPLPPEAEERLETVREQVASLDDASLDRELRQVDPASADRLHGHDRYRRQRALEVYLLAGRPFSHLAAEQQPDPAHGLAFPLVVLERSVTELDGRIVARTLEMLSTGWVPETAALLDRHPADCPGLLSIGYAEIVQHLSGDLLSGELPDAIALATRRYAKRQRTWFRPLPNEAQGSPEDPTLRASVAGLVGSALAALET